MREAVERSGVGGPGRVTATSPFRWSSTELGDSSLRRSVDGPVTGPRILSDFSRLPSLKLRVVSAIWRAASSRVAATPSHLSAPLSSLGIARLEMPIMQWTLSIFPTSPHMPRSFTVFYSAPDGQFARRFPALAHVPCILDSRPGYHRRANDYLIDRALAIWPRVEVGKKRIPSPKTLESYANWLANFLEWASVRSIDLKTCTYWDDLNKGYQGEMLKGDWSRTGRPLMPGTVNARVQQACDFLSWMVDRGLREAFDVPYRRALIRYASSTNPMGQISKPVKVRVGKVKSAPPRMTMPAADAVRKWLAATYRDAGNTLGLMCETILLTGMRREEVVCLRVDTLPEDPRHWHIVNPEAPQKYQQVHITIKFGTKGEIYSEDHGDKVGPSRGIRIPLELAKRWHAYRNGPRIAAFKQWMSGTEGAKARKARAQEAVHLFLNERNGRRFKGKQLYDAWKKAPSPVELWSPHKGRHWWACSVLQRELKSQYGLSLDDLDTSVALMQASALNIIRLHIQPQLGHGSDATTLRYLKWALDQIVKPLSLEDEV
jgi:integrase